MVISKKPILKKDKDEYDGNLCEKVFATILLMFVFFIIDETDSLNTADGGTLIVICIGFFFITGIFQMMFWPESNIFYWIDTKKSNELQDFIALKKRVELGIVFFGWLVILGFICYCVSIW